MKPRDQNNSPCTVRLDRLILTAVGRNPKPPKIEGYKMVKGFRPHQHGKYVTYQRVWKLQSLNDSSQIRIQYEPRMPWLQPWHITLIADDRTGILREQLDAILANCLRHRFSVIEIAFDFPSGSEIDGAFVLKHGQFGKSRRSQAGAGQFRFGSRSSTKLVRCYFKPEVDAYRIEPELHSALLRRIGLSDISRLGVLYRLIPEHFAFVRISWTELARYVRRKIPQDAEALLKEARTRRAKSSLRSFLRFMQRRGISNSHRFVQRMRINDEIKAALRSWLVGFIREEN